MSDKINTKKIKKAVLTILGLLVVFLIIKFTPIRIPCIIYEVTGFSCPGCGISHYFIDLFHLDFGEAFKENALVAVLFPCFILLFVLKHTAFKNKKNLYKKILNIFCIISIIAAILFGIIRNIPGFEFLRPAYAINGSTEPRIKNFIIELLKI